MLNKRELKTLQQEWYSKLDGFSDIEDDPLNPESPLRDWHSFKFISFKAQVRKEKRSEYQRRIDNFANDPQFQEITKLMVKHGHSKFEAVQVEYIWTLHRDGLTERRIACEMGCSQTCIHFILRRMRAWMALL